MDSNAVFAQMDRFHAAVQVCCCLLETQHQYANLSKMHLSQRFFAPKNAAYSYWCL